MKKIIKRRKKEKKYIKMNKNKKIKIKRRTEKN